MSSPGQAVTGIVGAVVGYLVGGPVGAYYGFMIGLTIGGALFPPDIDNPRPTPNQLQIQTSMYGAAVPVVFGSRRISGNLIWCGELQTHEEEVSGGGKGGGGSSSFKYSYSISMAWGLCMARDPRKTINRAWAGKDEITEESFLDCATIYEGDQITPDPTIAADSRVLRPPVWKNLCYVVLKDFPLGDSPVIPNFTFEVSDMEAGCFNKQEETAGPTNALHRLIYAGGKLFAADDLAAEIRISKIDPETMEVETSVSFPTTEYQLNSGGGVAGGFLEVTGTGRIAIAVRHSHYTEAGPWYILELNQTDLAVQAKIAVGDVRRGTDDNLYLCKGTNYDDPVWKPVTGEFWATMWELLDPDTTAYNLADGPLYKQGANQDCGLLYEDGYYYISGWESAGTPYLFKKRRADGADEYSLAGSIMAMCDGEDGYIYAACGLVFGLTVRKISKAGLEVAYDYVLSTSQGLTRKIFHEDGYVYILYAADAGNQWLKKISVSIDEWTEEAGYFLEGNSVADMSIIGRYLVLARQTSLMKFRKSDLTLICSDESESVNGLATDGTSLFASNQGTGRGVTKFGLPGTGGDVTPQAITKSITTDPLWGLGLDASLYWDLVKTDEAEAWAQDKDLLMSVVFDHQRSILDALQYVLQHHDGFITYMDGKIAHRQLTMEGAAPQFAATALSDDFSDGTPGGQWEVIR